MNDLNPQWLAHLTDRSSYLLGSRTCPARAARTVTTHVLKQPKAALQGAQKRNNPTPWSQTSASLGCQASRCFDRCVILHPELPVIVMTATTRT